MPLPYNSPATGGPLAATRNDADLEALRRFVLNLGLEQARDVKGLAYGLTVDPINQLGRSIQARDWKAGATPTPEEQERAKRGLALLTSFPAGSLGAGVAGRLLSKGPVARATLGGALAGATDAGVRSGGDPASMAGGMLVGAAGGSAFGKMAHAPGVVEIKNPLESTRRSLSALGPGGESMARKIDAMIPRANVNAGTAVHAFTEAGLDRLSREDDAALGLAMRGWLPLDRLSTAARRVYDVADAARRAVSDKAVQLNVRVTRKSGEAAPFKPLKNYFPKSTPEPAKLKSGPLRDEVIANATMTEGFPSKDAASRALDSWIQFAESGGSRGGDSMVEHLIRTGQARNENMARGMMMRFLSRPKVERFGNLERAREFNFPFYDPSPKRVMARYLENAQRRLSEVEHLGQDWEKLGADMALVAPEHRDLASYLIDSAVGARHRGDQRLPGLLGAGRRLSTFKLSPTSAIKNTGQTMNVLLRTDLRSTLGGFKDRFTPEGAAFAEASGATTEGAMRHSQHMVGAEDDLLRRYLRAIGFTSSERGNRSIASNAGRRYAEGLVKRLKKNPADEFAAKELERMTLDAESVGRYSALSDQEKKIAGAAVTGDTQFNSTGMDLPPSVQDSPWTWNMAQYKTYPYQQAQMLRREILDRLMRPEVTGDRARGLRNLAILLSVMPAGGEVINNAVEATKEAGGAATRAFTGQPVEANRVLEAIMGKARNAKGVERYMENLLATGGIGILSDVAGALDYNPAEWAVGPTLGTALRLGSTAADVMQNDRITPAQARYVYRQVPTVGPLTARTVFPSAPDATATKKPKSRKARKEKSR